MSDDYEVKVRAMCALLGVRLALVGGRGAFKLYLNADVGSFGSARMRLHYMTAYSWKRAYEALLTYRADVESDIPSGISGNVGNPGVQGTPGFSGSTSSFPSLKRSQGGFFVYPPTP